MSNLQELLNRSVESLDLPFVVAMVGTKDRVAFSGAAGKARADTDAGEATLFRIFSMTKAVCATAAVILMERGQLDTETPVDEFLPEFSDLRVLEGYDGDVPRLRKPKTRATVRQLATHTSGLEYEFWNPDVAAFMQRTGHPSVIAGTKASMKYPMMRDPGTRWGYGPGVDWLGLVVEAVDGRRIDDFCTQEIFEPLAMSDTHFELPARCSHRLADIGIRTERGNFAPFEIAPPANPEVYGMGHALYGSAPDYLTLLRMFLNDGELNGERILTPKGVQFLLADQLLGLRFEPMISVTPLSADFDPFPGKPMTHSFGFLRNEVDVAGMRSAGSQGWAGVLNSHYWFDPKQAVAAVFMTQSLPFCEARCMKRFNDFEKAVYAQIT